MGDAPTPAAAPSEAHLIVDDGLDSLAIDVASESTPILDGPALGKQGQDGSDSTPAHAHTWTRKKKKKDADQVKAERLQADPNAPLITPYNDPWPRPYIFEDGLRRVAPYHFTYNTWCKERWRNRQLLEVYEAEFRDRPIQYYRDAVDNGSIFVNGRKVGSDYVLRNGDLVSHTLHRHEPPVSGDPVEIIHEDDDMIVINKPAGVPVHPAGRYKFNSVIEIMKAERGPSFVPHPCNRLDRLTSGIMFIAKKVAAAEALGEKIAKRTVRKEYISRVIGRFPDGEVVCDQPILQISPKLGLNRVRANGKTARTVFKRLAYYPPPGDAKADGEGDGNVDVDGADDPQSQQQQRNKPKGYSIVRCLPVTGRTHQIRVHLQHLGYPIQNDPIYANQRVWGFDLGHDDADATQNTDEDIISRLSRMGKDEIAEAVAYYDAMVDKYEQRRAEKLTGDLCEICQTPLYSDPGSHELALWLHSLRYEDTGGEWAYVSLSAQVGTAPKGMNGPTTVGGMEDLVEAAKDDELEIS